MRGWKCCSDGGAATNEESENLPSAGRPLNREIRGNQREKETRKSTLEGIFLIPTKVQNYAPIIIEITKPEAYSRMRTLARKKRQMQ